MKAGEYISGFADLASIAEELSSERYIFRGCNSDFPLIPKIGRERSFMRERANQFRAYSEDEEKNVLLLFRDSASVLVRYPISSLMDWMAVAQHHGLPTRLLDWSESLFVAAYFACNNVDSDSKPTIYAVKGTVDRSDNVDPFALDEVKVVGAKPFSPRITAQRGVFTIHPVPRQNYEPSGLRKWHLRPEDAYKVKLCLDSIGMNYYSMQPDIDGLAELLGWRLKRDRLF